VAHLACFAGGMFAMGGVLFDKPEHVEIGSKLTDGCVWAYNVTASGIMPEGAEAMQCPDTWGDCRWNETAYWEELDPYWETRTQKPTPVAQLPLPNDDTDDDGDEVDDDLAPPKAPAAQIGPQPPTPSLKKRQLSQVGPDAFNKPAAPLPQNDAAAPQSPPALPQNPPAPQPVGGGSQTVPDEPLYTPLSHEAFVAAKIEDERLPPGFTRITHRGYILRPEAIESVFYMYRITGDQYWRDVGWNMFTSIDRHTRTIHGNSAIDDITKSIPELRDQEESFWLAETLKYFYLLYDEPSRWSLDEWVLNTEAHLFRRPEYKFKE
jgi:mannosyl-oligosaccharide alpha-1,2-mannosidase